MVCAIAWKKIAIIYNFDLFFIKIIVTFSEHVHEKVTNTKFGPYDKDFSHIYLHYKILTMHVQHQLGFLILH
jgi:hypothetical protein